MTSIPPSVTLDSGVQVSTNTQSEEQIRETFADELKGSDSDASEAAKKLGSRGGKAAAEARKEKAAQEPQEAAGDETDAEPAEDPRGQKDGRGKPRHDPIARMKEATRQAAEVKRQLAEERAARAAERAEYEALRARLSAPQPQPGAQGQPAPERAPQPQQRAQEAEDPRDPKPKEADYADYAEFVEARAAWSARQEWSRAAARAAQQRQHLEGVRRAQAEVDEFNARFTEEDKASLSDEVLSMTPSFMLAPGQPPTAETDAAAYIFRSAHGPALLRHLSDHPEERQRIAALPHRDAVVGELAKLEDRLSAATTAPSVKAVASKAHAPVRPVQGAPITSEEDPSDADSYDVWRKKRDAEERRTKVARR